MDVVQAVSGYVGKMMSLGDAQAGTANAKMKILLLDSETVSIISTTTTQSALLSHDVYLTDRIDNPNRERMRHLRCLCFLRPSAESIQLLIDELREPKYGEYNIYFSNFVQKSALERLAESDDHEVVRAVQEYYADFQVVNADLMSLGIGYPERKLFGSSPELWNPSYLNRSTQGLLALLLSLKKKPLIRHSRDSKLAKKLASEVRYHMTQEEQLFNFRRVDTPPILLILDRREDPLTPLLTQWTYQAMVHELLGIHTGRVDLKEVPNIRPELKEITLTRDADLFFSKNMYANFGDLGQAAKDYVNTFASKSATSQQMESIMDMKRFVEEYPEYRKLSGNVSKHVTLVGELSRRVASDNLLDVSELEQSLACSDNHGQDLKSLQQLIANPAIPDANKLRVTAIYALRYATHPSNALPMLQDLLKVSTSLSPADIVLIRYLLAYVRSLTTSSVNGPAAPSAPLPDIFTQPNALFSTARSRIAKGLKGVENVYTQHSPVLLSILELLLRNKLSTATHPFLDGQGAPPRDKPQDVIIFVAGGVTFEEARCVAQVNAAQPGVRVVLGGTSVSNSGAFWEQVRGSVEGWPDVLGQLWKGVLGIDWLGRWGGHNCMVLPKGRQLKGSVYHH